MTTAALRYARLTDLTSPFSFSRVPAVGDPSDPRAYGVLKHRGGQSCFRIQSGRHHASLRGLRRPVTRGRGRRPGALRARPVELADRAPSWPPDVRGVRTTA